MQIAFQRIIKLKRTGIKVTLIHSCNMPTCLGNETL